MRRHLGYVEGNLDRGVMEAAFVHSGFEIEAVDEEVGMEWREYAEERTQPVSKALLRLSRLRRQTRSDCRSARAGCLRSHRSQPALGALPVPRKVIAHRLRPACDGPSLNPLLAQECWPRRGSHRLSRHTALVPVTTLALVGPTPSLRARKRRSTAGLARPLSARGSTISATDSTLKTSGRPPARTADHRAKSSAVTELAGRAPSPRRRARALGARSRH